MRIYIMDTILPPQGSGWTTHKWELARNLAKLGHEVHVMTYEGTRVDGVIHPMKAREEYKFDFFFKIMHLVSILKVIRMFNFDIIYTRNVSFALLGLILIKILLKKSKLVLELNGLFSEDWKSEKKYMDVRNLIWNFLEIFVAKKVDAIITVSPGIKDILIEKGIIKDKIIVIPNGANTDIFKPSDDVLAIKKLQTQYNISENDNIVIFVGNLRRWHGVDYLVKSASSILNTIPNTKFLIVGSGPVKEELISMVEKMGMSANFIFTGTVPYEQVPLLINMADLCVAPFIRARNERMGLSPIKIYEYLACGKPVVASDIKGIGNLLRNSNAGIAVTPEDPVELANAIIKLLKNEKIRKQMGKNGRRAVVNNYSWYHTAKKTIEVFENILKRRNDSLA